MIPELKCGERSMLKKSIILVVAALERGQPLVIPAK